LKFRISIQYFLDPSSASKLSAYRKTQKRRKLISGLFFEQTLEIKSGQEKIKVLTRLKRRRVKSQLKRKTQTEFMEKGGKDKNKRVKVKC